ncbi:MAG: lipopolysaccharide biosynthesis protein [Parvularculaceae bacterium]|jgi:O-antigen/teichoic acid export membrane protein|nr:lipopolysaccharide biosynthesis protein [Parvularculaceae bacterium]
MTARQSANRIFRNAGALMSGKALGGVLSLAYLAIAARSLGPTEMGFLVLAHAYAMVVAGVARFQSWQAVIRFGAPMVQTRDARGFKSLIRYSVRLDILSAVFSIGVALLFVGPVARSMDWPAQAMPWVYAYCATVPFLVAATPTGVLRLFDRFKMLGWQLSIMPVTRFFGAIALFIFDGGLSGFLFVWILSAVLDGASLWILGWRELDKRGLLPSLRRDPALRPDREWLPFMIKTTLSCTVDLARTNLPVLIVGAVLGSAASGFLQLAVNASNLIAHPASMLYQATFPELSRISAAGKDARMRKVALRSALTGILVAAPIVLLFALLREPLARILGGPEFAPAASLIALMALAQMVRVGSVVLEAAVVSAGGAGFALFGQSLSAFLSLAALTLALPAFGVNAAPIAVIGGWALLAAMYVAGLCLRAPARA